MPGAKVDPDQMSNRRLGDRYELRERVGSGGMAEVWEGFDHNLSRRIAIKMLHPHLAADPTVLARFRSEAQAAARLTHPTIVAIYDTAGAEDADAIIMEFVEGRDLRTILNERPTLAAADAVEVGIQIAGALGHAHQNGIVHRDVKPANILVRPDRRVKLSDFGIAKALDEVGHTETGALIGTVKYLAPEQIEGNPVDGRTDLYALSTVLYEMLCGQVPFVATDLVGAMKRLRQDPPSARALRPDLPLALDAFLQKGLARNPDDRYDTAEQWSAALKEAISSSLIVDDADLTVVDARPPSSSVSIPLSQTDPTQATPLTTPPVPTGFENSGHGPLADVAQPKPSAKQRAKANPETAKHVKTGRSKMRWLGPIISLLLMIAAVATVWFLLTDAGDALIERFSGGDDVALDADSTENEAQDEAGSEGATDDVTDEDALTTTPPPVIDIGEFDASGLRVTSFDPAGDGEEHQEAVSLPFDGDPATFWFTERYLDRNFGQLKQGVGLIVEFSEPRPMQDLMIEANRTGWAFDLYRSDVVQTNFEDWGEPIGSFTDLDPSVLLDVDDGEVSALLFWVTDLGLDPEQTVEEYEAAVASGEPLQRIEIAELELVG